MSGRSPEDIRESIRSLVREAENAPNKVEANDTNEVPEPQETYNNKQQNQERDKPSDDNISIKETSNPRSNAAIPPVSLAGLLSEDAALAVRAEIVRYSEVFDTEETREIIYRAVSDTTKDMVKEWLDEHLASIVREVIDEALENIASEGRK